MPRPRWSWKVEEYATIALEVLGSIAVGLLAGGLLLAFLGYDPLQGLSVMLLGGLRSPDYLLSRATFIMLTGLAFAIPALAAAFNIGGEGQMYLGGLAALLTAVHTKSPLLAIAAGALAGGLLGLVIGALRAYRGVNEVITAIMLNWVVYYVLVYLITNRLYDPVAPHQSIPVPKEARLGSVSLGPLGSVHLIFPVALLLVALAYYLIYYTKIGYVIRVAGLSPKAAVYAGVDPERAVMLSMGLGGMFAGAAGALNVVGFTYYIDQLLTCMYGMGFDGIGVALMGRNHPIGIVFSSVFFSMLILGGQRMQMTLRAPKEVAEALSGVIVIALALPYAYRMLVSYVRTRRLVGLGRGRG